jgi:serine/threonine protein kinase/Flp pilus assembly protein TadD
MIGRTISHYEILTRLGEGGMGIVYKARDLHLGRNVALKFLRPDALRNEQRRARFLREARAAASLDHPNICTVHGIEEVDEHIFLAMALVEGTSLEQRLRTGPLEPAEAVRTAMQVALGLQAAHQHGIVHRDIKSSNIMLTRDSEAKILDFGLARVIEGPEATTTTAGIGTPAYMSPEQVRNESVDPRTDIWSWGVVFYEMLAGRLPFPGENIGAVVYSIVHEDPVSLDQLVPDLPTGLAVIATRALAKRPEDRYPDDATLLADLGAPERVRREAPPADTGPAKRRPSIAVLRFADISSVHDQGYFCEGLAEEIINDLAHLEGLRVASRTSVVALEDESVDVRAIGRRLATETVLEGSVRKSGERLRITAQLIDVTSGYHLWSEQYDRRLEDILVIQEEIARRIVDALKIRLSAREERSLEKPGMRDVQAYDLYLRGRQIFYRTKRDNLDLALQVFTEATQKDPTFAPALAGMADCHSYRYTYFGGDESDLRRALEASARALKLSPDRAEAHAARGLAVSLDKRYDEAEREFEEATRLNPVLYEALYSFGRLRVVQGRLQEAAELYERLLKTYPLDHQAPAMLGMTYRALGRPDAARAAHARSLENVERHLQLIPDDARATYVRAQELAELGRNEEALEWGRRAQAMAPDDSYITYGLACLYSRLGERSESLHHLEAATRAGFVDREWADKDPDLDAIRDDPRYGAIFER